MLAVMMIRAPKITKKLGFKDIPVRLHDTFPFTAPLE
jgi:hypothetical protein